MSIRKVGRRAAATAVAGLVCVAVWIDRNPEVIDHPSRTGSARLAVLEQDAILPGLEGLLGAPAEPPVSEHCRDTEEGPRPADVHAEFPPPAEPLSADRITELGEGAGWETTDVTPHTDSTYTLNLRKTFGGWSSLALVTVTEDQVSIELDATDTEVTDEDDCP